MLRQYVAGETRRAKLSAVVGIVSFVCIPLNYLSIRIWRTQHPSPVIAGGAKSGIDPLMFQILFVTFFSMLVLFIYLLRERIRLEKLRDVRAAL